MKELSLNILDITENSVKAGASLTQLLLTEQDGVRCGYYFNLNPLPELDDAVARALEASEIYYFSHKTDPVLAVPASRFRSICLKEFAGLIRKVACSFS